MLHCVEDEETAMGRAHTYIYRSLSLRASKGGGQGCHVAEKYAKLCFIGRRNFGFYCLNFYRIKKGQLLNKFSKISRTTNLKKNKFFGGFEKAKLDNPGGGIEREKGRNGRDANTILWSR